MASFTPMSLPDESWVDLPKHAFAKELVVRPGGVYPKYGAVDRDYYGPEYDGFQDIFTMSAYANLECDRFDEARAIIDNYLPAERFRKALRDEAGGNIRAAAGRERDDQPDRFGRVQILCACANRGKRDEYSENCDYARHGFLRHHVSRQFLRRGLDLFKLFAERRVVHA
jgi:hypothetical protein